jgi:hypothetical protein
LLNKLRGGGGDPILSRYLSKIFCKQFSQPRTLFYMLHIYLLIFVECIIDSACLKVHCWCQETDFSFCSIIMTLQSFITWVLGDRMKTRVIDNPRILGNFARINFLM